MSANSLDSKPRLLPRVARVVMYLVWVVFSFIASQFIIAELFLILAEAGVPIKSMLNTPVFSALFAALSYGLTLLIIVGISRFVRLLRTNKLEIGLQRLPTWSDILMGLVGIIPYVVLSGVLTYIASQIVPGFQLDQKQDVGFNSLTSQGGMLLAFLTLVVLAPLAEEAIFRGYLYGKLRKNAGKISAILLTSLCFATLHFQLNVGIDVFALSIVLCLLRETSGSIWPGIILHMTKNGLAFYLLFVNPIL